MPCRAITRFLLTVSLLAMTVAILGLTPAAFAQVDNPNLVFQLDSNVVTDTSVCFVLTSSGAFTAAPSGSSCPSGFQLVTFVPSSFGANIPADDWDLIANGTSHAAATSFIGPSTSPAEAINSTADSIFTGGGSKDISGIASWAWKNGKPQGKDDIEHAFAAAYTLTGVVNGIPGTCGGTSGIACDTGIYFGMTRFDNSGDATAGFWFFQDGHVGLAGGSLNGNKDPICGVGSGCPFSGHHSNNDLLIVSDFSQGGPITSIQAFAWKCSGTGATCDSTGSLQAASSVLTANITCNPTTGASDFCAISNATAGLSVPFGFVNKSGQTAADHGEILEGGLDLNVIFPNGLPCFSTFMAETRSSNSPTATLSDLTPPVSFPLCGASITKTCTGAQFVNDPISGATSVQYSFSGTVKNTGIGALSSVCVTDTPGANLVAGSVSVVQPPECATGSLGPGATTTYSGSFQTTAASSTEGNTATVNAVSAIGGGAISPASASWIVSPATQLPNACQPAPGPLTIDKTCTVAIVPVNNILELQVQFSGTVTNNSGVQVTGLSVTDNPSTTITLGKTTLNNGASTSYSGSYFPSACTTSDGGRCAFSDTVSAQGSGGASTGTISSSSVGATCHLCPPGACSTAP